MKGYLQCGRMVGVVRFCRLNLTYSGAAGLLEGILVRCSLGRKLQELRGVSANAIPRCLGANENVHLNLNTWISIDSSEGHSVHLAVGCTTQRGSTGLTEAQTPSRRRLIEGEILITAEPGE